MGRFILEHCVVVEMQASITIDLQIGVICRGTLSPLNSVTTRAWPREVLEESGWFELDTFGVVLL
jgi:hypothetical protein